MARLQVRRGAYQLRVGGGAHESIGAARTGVVVAIDSLDPVIGLDWLWRPPRGRGTQVLATGPYGPLPRPEPYRRWRGSENAGADAGTGPDQIERGIGELGLPGLPPAAARES